jgi:hypothetical protein
VLNDVAGMEKFEEVMFVGKLPHTDPKLGLTPTQDHEYNNSLPFG